MTRKRLKIILGVFVAFGCGVLVMYWEIVGSDIDIPNSKSGDDLISLHHQSLKLNDSSTGTFKKLHQDIYIYSAFLDEQHQVIRLIVLTGKHYQPKLECHYCDEEKSCRCPSRQAQYYTNNENHGRQYGGFIVSCQLPDECGFGSYYIQVAVEGETSKVQIPLISLSTAMTKHKYSICIPPLRGKGTEFLYQLTEFIEVSLKLGASHLTFYDYKTDEPIKKLLSYYREQGVVRLLFWDIPSHMTSDVSQVWYHGQILAIQDCLYRNKATSKFVAFNDIDEYIVPLKHSTVPLFLYDIHTAQHCGYCFDSVIFSLNARIPGAHGRKNKLRTLRIQYRTSKSISSWSKCIVDPQQVFEMGIHHISKPSNDQLLAVRVSNNDMLVFHYRTCSSALYGIGNVCGDLVADSSMDRFTTKLQHKVDQVINYIKKV